MKEVLGRIAFISIGMGTVFAALLVLISCQTPSKVKPVLRTSTTVDTARLDQAVAKADSNQDVIKKDAESLVKTLPDDDRPPRIVEHAVDTKVQLALAKQTIDDLKAKDTSNSEAAKANAEMIAGLEANLAELQAEVDSGTAWFFFLMIAGGAIGIPIGLAITMKIDKAWGTFVLITAVGSVVTGFILKDYACWIAPIGGIVALLAGGVLGWRQLTAHEDQAAEDETVLLETVRTAEAMKEFVPEWHTENVQKKIAMHQTAGTVDRIRAIRIQDKLTRNPDHLQVA